VATPLHLFRSRTPKPAAGASRCLVFVGRGGPVHGNPPCVEFRFNAPEHTLTVRRPASGSKKIPTPESSRLRCRPLPCPLASYLTIFFTFGNETGGLPRQGRGGMSPYAPFFLSWPGRRSMARGPVNGRSLPRPPDTCSNLPRFFFFVLIILIPLFFNGVPPVGHCESPSLALLRLARFSWCFGPRRFGCCGCLAGCRKIFSQKGPSLGREIGSSHTTHYRGFFQFFCIAALPSPRLLPVSPFINPGSFVRTNRP